MIWNTLHAKLLVTFAKILQMEETDMFVGFYESNLLSPLICLKEGFESIAPMMKNLSLLNNLQFFISGYLYPQATITEATTT